MNDLNKARQHLTQEQFTCVLCRGEETVTCRERGVAPLLRLLDSGHSFRGFSAADKVVGKAAAMLYVRLGVSAVWAGIISEPAVRVLNTHGIAAEYDCLVRAIRNRTDTGNCPMETAVWELEDPAEGEKTVRSVLQRFAEK